MEIHYDLKQINKLLSDIYTITGLTLGFWDNKMNLMTVQPPGQNPFCKRIRSTPEGLKRCISSDREILKQCAATHSVCTHRCHAGLHDSAVPLYFKDQLLGFITYGQMHNTSEEVLPFDKIADRLKDLPLDTERLHRDSETLPRYSREQLDAITTVAMACIRYTLFEKMIFTRETTRFEEVSEFIDLHLHQNITYETLMKEFHVSRSTLYDTFYRHAKMPVHAYIEKKRMERAADLLLHTADSVAAIAFSVGMEDQNYFTRRFKKYYSLSPLKYRKIGISDPVNGSG